MDEAGVPLPRAAVLAVDQDLWVGGWVGDRKVEETLVVRMSYWTWGVGRVGGWGGEVLLVDESGVPLPRAAVLVVNQNLGGWVGGG